MGNTQLLEVGGDPGRVIDARRRERDAAGPEENSLAGVGLELPPGAEGRGHEPGIRRVCVRVPRDPRGSVRAAAVVTERKLLDQKNRLAPPREMICRRRAHRAGTDDHVLGVKVIHRVCL